MQVLYTVKTRGQSCNGETKFHEEKEEDVMKAMKRFVEKKVLVVLVVALAGMLLIGMTGCSQQSNEEVIRNAITEEFDQMKNLDQAMLDEIIGQNAGSMAELEQLVDVKEYFRAWFTDFDYTIDEVVVEGNQATVKMTVTCKSLVQGMQNWEQDYQDPSKITEIMSLSEEERTKKLGSMMVDAIKDAPMETNSGELPYTLNGNTWEPGPGYESVLAQMIGLSSVL